VVIFPRGSSNSSGGVPFCPSPAYPDANKSFWPSWSISMPIEFHEPINKPNRFPSPAETMCSDRPSASMSIYLESVGHDHGSRIVWVDVIEVVVIL
jgi:hypothetical protein